MDPVYPELLNGRYEIVNKEYKTGGTAVISLAKECGNDQKLVIIKKPRSDTDHSAKFYTDKLCQEAEYLRGVNHPNIMKFVDLFKDHDNMPNLVVEYNDGEDLLSKCKFSPVDEQSAVKWAVQILNALEYIHKSGFIYRDLNPSHLMVNPDNNIKLIDFGAVKTSGFSSDTVCFKPGFIVPEIAAKGFADEKSDIYGVGEILYYILTCERPAYIRGRNKTELLLERNVSQRTAHCIAQALQLDSNYRFQSAAAMRRALTGG